MKCVNCIYSELVISEGELYSFMNPNGDEVKRQHTRTIYICREGPPISGDWPQVSEDDWCGRFKGSK